MAVTLDLLPSELVVAIIAHLSIPSLLAFAATSSSNQKLAHKSLHSLNLAILPKDIHCRLALIAQDRDSDQNYDDLSDFPRFSVTRTTKVPHRITNDDKNPGIMLDKQISTQNEIAYGILRKDCVYNLRSLSLHMYDIRSSDLASIMARNLSQLRELELKFYHPYIHDQSLPSSYWRDAPDGSPCWNALAGLGVANRNTLRLHGLQVLKIQRAGLTSVQLRKFIEANPRLRYLHLDNVTGVDLEFAQWVAEYCGSGRSCLERVSFEKCSKLRMQQPEDFAWLARATGDDSVVKSLSLSRCPNIRMDILMDLVENGQDHGIRIQALESFVPPRGPARRYGVIEEASARIWWSLMETGAGMIEKQLAQSGKIDVDPDFIVSPKLVTA